MIKKGVGSSWRRMGVWWDAWGMYDTLYLLYSVHSRLHEIVGLTRPVCPLNPTHVSALKLIIIPYTCTRILPLQEYQELRRFVKVFFINLSLHFTLYRARDTSQNNCPYYTHNYHICISLFKLGICLYLTSSSRLYLCASSQIS